MQPAFIVDPQWAVSQGDQFTIIPFEKKEIYEKKYSLIPISKVIFGFIIPYLPDLMKSPNLIGNNESERLEEIINSQIDLITNLHKWDGTNFSLRYQWDPLKKKIDIILLGSCFTPHHDSQSISLKVFQDISTQFSSRDIPISPITDISELKRFLDPIPGGYITEIRQQEQIMHMVRGDAYVVVPYAAAPKNTWINFFKSLCNLSEPCLINIHLQNTVLTPRESDKFSLSAQLAATFSHEHYQGYSGTYEWNDPVAETVSKLYTGYIQRFRSPFLIVAQIVSNSPNITQSLAQNLMAEVINNGGRNDNSNEPSGAQTITAVNPQEIRSARKTLTSLDLSFWGNQDAGEGQERLQYLVDAKAACSLFRFPIAIRGGIPGIMTRQVVPVHETGTPFTETNANELYLGTFLFQDSKINLPTKKLNQHTLVAGTNGSGKTTTCFQILSQLHEKKIPFLVIEPAKAEYRTLIESPIKEQLLVFTLGDESVSPFRLNPLEIFTGVRVETHISYLKACFQAALPTFGILPSLIEESLLNIYMAKGWNLIDRGKINETREMPTLGELYDELIRVTNERGYSEKTAQDIRAAATGRIGSLLRGSKGRMLNTRRSIPIDTIMNQPVILELESLNDEEKALVMLFILTSLREYCRANRSSSDLQHVTLIEEAHRIMSATAHVADRENQADIAAAAVGMVSAALSEVRAYGEGFIIAEQIPSRLAEDALKNTNLKIIHRLPGEDDRNSVGATMNMEEEQKTYLIKLLSGQAAIFMEGYERPTFTYVHNYRLEHNLPEKIEDEMVQEHMNSFFSNSSDIFLPYSACQFCLKKCLYRDRIANIVFDHSSRKRFSQAFTSFSHSIKEGDEIMAWSSLVDYCKNAVAPLGLAKDINAAFCYLSHYYPGNFPKELSNKFRQAFLGG